MARQPTRKTADVLGIFLPRPPSSSMLRVCVETYMLPAPKKSKALNRAWFSV